MYIDVAARKEKYRGKYHKDHGQNAQRARHNDAQQR